MSKYHEKHYEYGVSIGNSINLKVGKCDSEIRADIVVNEHHSVRLWGCVVNCNGYPVPNALVKLLRIVKSGHGYNYVGVAHTITDCDGLYQFDIFNEFDCDSYKVIVSKAATGSEMVIDTKGYNCHPCECKPIPKCDCYEKSPYVEPTCNKPCHDDMFDYCECEKHSYQDVYNECNYTIKKNTAR